MLNSFAVGTSHSASQLAVVIKIEQADKAQLITFNLTPDRVVTLPQGLHGGRPGRIGEVLINGERVHRFPPLLLMPGDLVELRLPGGGGFGPVEQREPERVLTDLTMGYITPKSAVVDYALPPERADMPAPDSPPETEV